jgi:antitoxin component YwqK of YwqJK toxin-antitoxin module
MSEYGYRIFWIVLAALFVGFILAALTISNDKDPVIEQEVKKPESEVKEGTVDHFDAFGNLKTRITYYHGYKHGISYLYYPDGKIQLAMPYEYGKREGISKKYFEDGSIYAETPYQNDLLSGTRFLYYRNGNKKSQSQLFAWLAWKGIARISRFGGRKNLK